MHGKNNEPLVIVDADSIISFVYVYIYVYVEDEKHIRAKAIMQQLAISQSSLLFPKDEPDVSFVIILINIHLFLRLTICR